MWWQRRRRPHPVLLICATLGNATLVRETLEANQQKQGVSTRSGPSAHEPSVGAVEQMLGRMLDYDQRILARFDDVMEELKTTKVRVLRRPVAGH